MALTRRMSLDLIGAAELDPELASTLSLDFDVRHGAQPDGAADAVVVLASSSGVRAALAGVRSRTDAPVIVVLRDGTVADRVGALEAGADDLVCGAFEPAELLARLRALLRRAMRVPGAKLRVDDLEIDVARHTVRRGARTIELSRLELTVLLTLARYRGAVVPHCTLIREVWGAYRSMGTVHTFMSYLRAKLESGGEPPLVHTVRGVGYALRSSGVNVA